MAAELAAFEAANDEPGMFVSLANSIPIHFRAPLIVTFTWFCWGVNIFVFRYFNIDYADLLGFERSSLLSPLQIWSSALAILGVISLACYLYVLFPLTEGSMVMPATLYVLALWLLFLPIDVLHKSGRERLLYTFYRVLVPLSSGVAFVEVLLGDVLTSLCKVIADMELSLCVLLAHVAFLGAEAGLEHVQSSTTITGVVDAEENGGAVEEDASLGCGIWWVRPLVTSIPFLLRFRQCIHQYLVTGKAFPNLVNAAKYVSSMPVIWLSALLHLTPEDDGDKARQLHTVWVFAISFNSFFAFMWDVLMDWGLCRGVTGSGAATAPAQIETASTLGHGRHAFLLRDKLIYSNPCVYYMAIVSDFLLRVLWSFKLSVHLQLSQDGMLAMLEMCEVFRRTIWIFFRVEWQQIVERAHDVSDVSAVRKETLAEPTDDAEVGAGATTGTEVPVVTDGGPGIVVRNRILSDRC